MSNTVENVGTSEKPRDIESGGLERTLSCFGAFAVIVGSIIGSGIFANGVVVYKEVPFSILALGCWIFGGVAAICGGLTWAEWALTVPEGVGDVGYLDLSYKKPRKLFSTIYIIARTVVIHPLTIAALGCISANFIGNAIPNENVKKVIRIANLNAKGYKALSDDDKALSLGYTWIMKACSVGVLAVAFCMVAFSNKIVLNSVKFLTVFKQSLLVVLIILGVYMSTQVVDIKNTSLTPAWPSKNDTFEFSNLASAMLTVLFCYDGFANLSTFIMELKEPSKNTLPAITFSTVSVTILYVIVNIFYLVPIPANQFKKMQSGGFASNYVIAAFPNSSEEVKSGIRATMSIFFFTSAFGAAISYLYSSSRLAMSAGEQGYYPVSSWFAAVNKKFRTPFNGTLFQIGMAMFYILILPSGDAFDFLCASSAYVSWILYFMSALGLIITRFTEPNLVRPFKAPIFAPIFVILCGLFLIIVQLTKDELFDKMKGLLGWIVILLTVVYYYAYMYRKLQKASK